MDSFAQPDFDAKAWINQTLKKEDYIKQTSTLVNQLQIDSEDCSRQFEQISTSLMRSLPRLVHDVKIMTDDASRTLQRIQSLEKTTSTVHTEADRVLNKLKTAHEVKLRMEQCQTLIKDSQ